MRRPWPGCGYIHTQADGRDLYIIERKIHGRRFHVSTCAHSPKAAMIQFQKFESSPETYNPGSDGELGKPVFLTTELIVDYTKHCLAPKEKGGRGNTNQHAHEKGNRLADWQADLEGRDLRALDLIKDLKGPLGVRETCRAHRIIAIKNFFAWLRTEKGLVTHAQDRTLDLLVPQAVPEQQKRKKVVPWEHVQKVTAKLKQRYLDVLTLKVATGMHMTELQRFVRDADSELVAAPTGADHLAAMRFLHKGRKITIVPLVHPEQLAAATRLKTDGTFPSRLNKELKAACKEAGVKDFTFGLMRHSVATWAIQDGASAAEVAVFIGHEDPKTTRRFYIDHNVPVPAIPTRRLKLVS